MPWRQDLVQGAPRVVNGFYELPTGPGQGIGITEAVIRTHPGNPAAKMDMFSLGWEQRMRR